MDSLLLDIIKSGTAALVMAKISKSIGQKDISDIISGSGWCIVGLDIILLITPICDKIGGIIDKGSAFINDFKALFRLPMW